MGVEAGISKSGVSRICAGLDETVGALRTLDLDHTEFPYVYLDATYLNVRNTTSQVVSMAVVVATGIAADSSWEVLGLDVCDSEDETFWRGLLTNLKPRGVHGVKLVISDHHSGLKWSFQSAGHQRWRVHFAATCSPTCRSPTPTWSPTSSARSSPNPTPKPRRRHPARRRGPGRYARRVASR
ncbi:hypothetical protein GCM10023350_30060 [Nocardioides endophyticus]|uniref:Mutator family transposase n=1 Tax=Nocardioides endophyticus TaxID=1353775 RepID=A0ABP8Z0Z8_9ACTN